MAAGGYLTSLRLASAPSTADPSTRYLRGVENFLTSRFFLKYSHRHVCGTQHLLSSYRKPDFPAVTHFGVSRSLSMLGEEGEVDRFQRLRSSLSR